MNDPTTNPDPRPLAEQVLHVEADAIARITINESFGRAVQLIFEVTAASTGSVVVSGLGKSGLIGQKLAATFASTGTHSHFLHPTEAMHGDLGRVRRGDVVVLLSRGGSTEEVVALAGILKQDGVPVIAITARSGGELSRLAAITLEIGDTAEACPLNLAPTASTTAMLALGDALALCVMQRRGFGADDFARVHPGGAIGRQLAPVHEVMRFRVGENLPLIQGHVQLCEAYEQAERTAEASGLRRPGAVIVVDPAGKLTGILTDGDLRRALIADGPDAWHRPVDSYMSRTPTTLQQTDLVRDAVHLVREHRFDELPVIDAAGRPIGMIDVQDLMTLKVIEG